MNHVLTIFALCAFVVVSPRAQPNASRVLVGNTISGGFRTDAMTGAIVETATLTFEDGPNRSSYTVEFVTSHAARQAASLQGVVDVIVT